jgi:hypothetical protein
LQYLFCIFGGSREEREVRHWSGDVGGRRRWLSRPPPGPINNSGEFYTALLSLAHRLYRPLLYGPIKTIILSGRRSSWKRPYALRMLGDSAPIPYSGCDPVNLLRRYTAK